MSNEKRALKVLADRFYEETARVEEMVFIAGAMGDDVFPSDLEDFFVEEGDESLAAIFGVELPEHVKDELEANMETDSLREWLLDQRLLGFLVKFSTPVMEPDADLTARRYSWGWTRSAWVYGDTMESALDKGFAWVAEQRKKEDAAAKGGAE